MNYYIADMHFTHPACIDFDHRPFESVGEMDEAMITNWNARVTQEDSVYVLGDAFFKNEEKSQAILRRLNGHKHLIRGNHDRVNGKLGPLWESIQPYLELVDEGKHLILCHYPMPFYNRAHCGSIMLYGHVHNSIEWELLESCKKECAELTIPCDMINVGCMMPYINYTPRTLQEILAGNGIER